MVSIPVYGTNGKESGKVEADDKVFAVKTKGSVVHAAVLWYLASQRQGTASTKTRSEVRGGGKKPWKQKGTGRARAGTIRSPLWRGGAVLFGPKPRDYSYNLNKKTKDLAIMMAMSEKATGKKIKAVDMIDIKSGKTKDMQKFLETLKVDNALIVADATVASRRAAANIAKIKLVSPKNVKVFDILKYEWLLFDKAAVSMLEERFSK